MAGRERHVDGAGGQPEAHAQRQQRRDEEARAQGRGQRLAAGKFGIDRAPAQGCRVDSSHGEREGCNQHESDPGHFQKMN